MKKKGYTVTELVSVLAVMGIMVSAALPAIHALQQEALSSKAEKEIHTLKAAVDTYYAENKTLPANVGIDLLKVSNPVIDEVITDPFNNDELFSYERGKTSSGIEYYIIYSKGPESGGEKNFSVNNNMVYKHKNDIVVSSLPVIEEK